ncbi:hypothetical protein ACZ90_69060 [Streptomyces albus subsp. albus]|nr:hypothetical protein ACZ90_69060 [Streptomyces albus subsp. albus]
MTQAKGSGRNVEILSLRGEQREVYATPDGHLEAVEHLRPVRARVAGEWKPVDTDLTRTRDGMVAPKAATLDLAFSGGGDGPMVRMARTGRQLALSWPGKLPEPTLDGPTATYPEVLPGVDLRLSAETDGYSQLLVVKSATAAASPALEKLRLSLDAEGVQVQETPSGGLEAVDNGAKSPVFEASTPVMWDSSQAPGTASAAPGKAKAASPQGAAAADGTPDNEPGAGESGKLAPIGVDVSAGGEALVLTPDHEVLKGKDTVYPVFIDPRWDTPKATTWTMASKYWANAPQWKFNGKSTEGLGLCEWYYCNPYDTKRLFYQIPTSAFAGKSILSAEFVVRNAWSASCSARQVELWRTKGISSSTTWNSQNASGFWIDRLAEKSFAHGFEGCAEADAEFDVKSTVQMAADKRWSATTFGLRAGSESDRYAWKRFSDKAFLRVKYNRPPPQIKMGQLRMQYGGACVGPDKAKRVRSRGQLYANEVTDPDGDQVQVQFQAAWDAGDGKGTIARWKPGLTTRKKSGESFAISLPSSLPVNKTISWYARTYDGAQYSPWSSAGSPTSCYFVYDTKAPAAPRVTSSEYPNQDPDDVDAPWLDGMGQYGSFTIDVPDSDVTRYRWGFNEASAEHEVATVNGAPRVVTVLPSKPGLNVLEFQAVDTAGNLSEISYQFRVKAGQPERARWQLDEGADASEAKGSAPPREATLHGGAHSGAPGAVGTALELDGTTGYADSDIPVVDTDEGFSVSAWVKLDQVPDHAAIIAAQPGNHRPGFELYYSSTYGRWVFNQYTSDSPGAGVVRAMAAQPGGVQAGQWTHLVGSYDAVEKKLRLFVDGRQVGETSYTTAWNARRGLRIGAGSYSGQTDSYFPGAIDELQFFDKRISTEEVARLFAKERVGAPGRPATAIFPFDEDPDRPDKTVVTAYADVLPARLVNGAKPGSPGIKGKALTLDGVDDHARVGAPHLNSSRSFAVSLWANLPEDKPSRSAVALSQGGTHNAGFELYYSAAYDRWVVNQHTSDVPDAGAVRAMQPEGSHASAGWTHLVGVHDTVADTLTLYVNGRVAGSAKLAGAWYAGGPMFMGAGSYDQKPGNFFPGQIDDVRLYDRPVSAGEVQQLFKQSPVLKGRWQFEEPAGTPATSADSSAERNALTLYGKAKIGTGKIGNGGLQLNGVDQSARTGKVPVDTDKSFTITTWAQASGAPADGPVSVVSAEGTHDSAFSMRYVPDKDPEVPGRWQLAVPDQDGSPKTTTEVGNHLYVDPTEWTHLAVVYDGFLKSLSLYVNGELEQSSCADADGDGEADMPECADRISWTDDVLTFKAGTSFQIGRSKAADRQGEYWPGAVDDVWAFQGALTEGQVAKLAHGLFDMPTEVPSE